MLVEESNLSRRNFIYYAAVCCCSTGWFPIAWLRQQTVVGTLAEGER